MPTNPAAKPPKKKGKKNSPARGKLSKTRVKTLQLMERAVALREAGMSFTQIAKAIDRTPGRAFQLVDKKMQMDAEAGSERAERIREMELRRLDGMLRELWARMRGGVPGKDGKPARPTNQDLVRIVDAILRIQERRAKYLGLDAPTVLAGVNLEALSDEQLRALAAGESVYSVLAEVGEMVNVTPRALPPAAKKEEK